MRTEVTIKLYSKITADDSNSKQEKHAYNASNKTRIE